MPLRQDFSSFRQPVSAVSPLQQAFSNVQNMFANMEAQNTAKKQFDEKMLLQKAADQRAQEQLALTQADVAKRDFTQNMIGKILSAPQAERADMLAEVQKTQGGFSPNVQEYSILQKALEAPKVAKATGTASITFKDGSTSTVPVAEIDAGRFGKPGVDFNYGVKSKKGSGGGGNGIDKKGSLLSSDYMIGLEKKVGEDDANDIKHFATNLQQLTNLPDADIIGFLKQSETQGSTSFFGDIFTDKKLDPAKATKVMETFGITPLTMDDKGNVTPTTDYVKALTNPNMQVRTIPDPKDPNKKIKVLYTPGSATNNNSAKSTTPIDAGVPSTVLSTPQAPEGNFLNVTPQNAEDRRNQVALDVISTLPQPESYLDKVLQGAQIRGAQAIDNPGEVLRDAARGVGLGLTGLVTGTGDILGVSTPTFDSYTEALRAGMEDPNSLGADIGEILAPVGVGRRAVKAAKGVESLNKAVKIPSVGTAAGKTVKAVKNLKNNISSRIDKLMSSKNIPKSSQQRKKLSQLREMIRTKDTDLTTAELERIKRKIDAVETSMNKNLLKGN